MAYRVLMGKKKPPKGWELMESVILDFEGLLKDAVNEEHEGKRKCELTWQVHRLHWEKNRFIFDIMYKRKAISRELFDWLVRNKIADGPLIAKWRKPGYENLCSLLAIQKGNHNFGGTSHCRVPLKLRGAQQKITPDVQTGCISCASGDGKMGQPIWWNTPMEDEEEENPEEHRTTWTQPQAESRKRQPVDETEELDDEQAKRLKLLKG